MADFCRRTFTQLPSGSTNPQVPYEKRQDCDLLILARGGGSLEDLWAFNTEVVAHAIADSSVPVISGVGHETDTTLIDYVSDARAPTPTGAAEIAVPVRSELQLQLDDIGQRLKRALVRNIRRGVERVEATRLPRPERLLDQKRQRYDGVSERLPMAVRALVERRRSRLDAIGAGLISPKQIVREKQAKVENLTARLGAGLSQAAAKKRIAFARSASRLRPEPLVSDVKRARKGLTDTARRARPALTRILTQKTQAFSSQEKLLETLSYQATLKRGYAIVRDPSGKVLRTTKQVANAGHVALTLSDGDVALATDGSAPVPAPPKPAKPKAAKSKATDQGDLF